MCFMFHSFPCEFLPQPMIHAYIFWHLASAILLFLHNWQPTLSKLHKQTSKIIFFHSHSRPWLKKKKKSLCTPDLCIICFFLFFWHNLIKIFLFFSFGNNIKHCPWVPSKCYVQRLRRVDEECAVCVCVWGRRTQHDWVCEWQRFSVEWIMCACEVWEHLISSAAVMAS